MKKTKKIIKYIFYSILVCLVSLCCYVFVCLDILHKNYVDIFGYTYFIVVSGSMTGEIEVNDIVFVKITKNVKVKEIIAYIDENKSVITHRLVEINNGKYIAKGDANDSYDKAITKDAIIGKVVYILTPKIIMEFAILIAIIFIALALLNFDSFFKKFFKKDVEEIDNNLNNKQVNNNAIRYESEININTNENKENTIKEFNNQHTVEKEIVYVDNSNDRREIIREYRPIPITEKQIVYVDENGREVRRVQEQIKYEEPKIEYRTEPKEEKKEVLPQDIFCSPQERKNFNEHSGLTITIPLDELKELKRTLESQEKFEFREGYTQDLEILELDTEKDDIKTIYADRKKYEDNIYSIIDAVLKVKNNAIETTHLTKEWQLKYEYIYKLCLILQDEKYFILEKEVNNVPFKEFFDYDINQVGLYKELRDKIYEMPIYGLLKVLFYSILYNDEKFFDGIFKIMKYKVLIDKNNTFIPVKEKYDKKRLKELIVFMENVARKYNKDKSLNLDRVKSLNKISNY